MYKDTDAEIYYKDTLRIDILKKLNIIESTNDLKGIYAHVTEIFMNQCRAEDTELAEFRKWKKEQEEDSIPF
jgi:hypothetical protein